MPAASTIIAPLPRMDSPVAATRMISNEATANSAPTGSLTMPSHLRNWPVRPPSFDCRSSGMITVGPVTTMTPAKTMELDQSSPAA